MMSIYDAAMKYKAEGMPLVVLAGAEYGSGSSRDWAAKGPFLQGVRAVLAASFERIHRSNLVMMGILPLEFEPGHDVAIARPHRRRSVRHSRSRRQAASRGRRLKVVATESPGQAGTEFERHRPHRHAGRARLLPQRRHSADGAAEVAEGLIHKPA